MTRDGVLRLLTLCDRVAVRVCPLCAALVLATGMEQHERVHAASGGLKAPSDRRGATDCATPEHRTEEDRSDGDQPST